MQQCKTVYLVRHGHVEMPDARKYYLGQTDVPLSEQGVKQAEQLKALFAEKKLKAVYHSPLSRCVQTAEILSDGKTDCIAVYDLQEISMGSWEMLPMEKIKSEQPGLYQQRGEQIDIFCPPDGESFIQCQARNINAFQDITASLHCGETAVIVAHAGVNRCLISWLTGQPLKNLLTISQPYACVTKLTETDSVWQITDAIECPVK